MTEDEARKKWCPFAHIPDAVSPIHGNSTYCIASDCMMWKWDAGEGVANPNPKNTKHGYCGLAK